VVCHRVANVSRDICSAANIEIARDTHICAPICACTRMCAYASVWAHLCTGVRASTYIARTLILAPSHVTISSNIYVICVYIIYICTHVYIHIYTYYIYKCMHVWLDIARYWCRAFQTDRPRDPSPCTSCSVSHPLAAPFRSRKLIKVQLIKITYFSSIVVDEAGEVAGREGGERQRFATGKPRGGGSGEGSGGGSAVHAACASRSFFPFARFLSPFLVASGARFSARFSPRSGRQ